MNNLLDVMDNELINKKLQDKTIHFIGLGAAGCNVLELIYKKGVIAKYTCISHPVRKHLPTDIGFIHFIPPGKSDSEALIDRFKSSDMNVELVLPDKILTLFNEDHRYILLAGLGGYTGTYMTEKLMQFLTEKTKDFYFICGIPFSFEKKRKTYAETLRLKFKELRCIRYFELDLIRKKYGNVKMNDVFELIDEEYYSIFREMFPGSA